MMIMVTYAYSTYILMLKLVLRMIKESNVNVEDYFLCHALHKSQTLMICWFHVSFVPIHPVHP